MNLYTDNVICPHGHHFKVRRHISTAGTVARTYCAMCERQHAIPAGPVPLRAVKLPQGPTHERHVEARLVKRVGELGGEVRKVQWIGRRGAPDRLVMLPKRRMVEDRTIWVELKAPGKAAKFPATAHERAQHREHERMRKMGQRVEVVDSYEQIEELLK